MRKNFFLLAFALIVCNLNALAQRHYKGVSGLEFNGGVNIFNEQGYFYNLSYSQYQNRTFYYKIGLNYLENPTDNSIARDFFFDTSFYKSFAGRRALFLSIGLGCFSGIETFPGERNEKRVWKWIIGPKLDLELEWFIAKNVGFVFRAAEYWNPMAVNYWTTTANAGLKILLY